MAATLMSELHVMILGIAFCLENDIGPIVMLTDSLLVIHVLHGTFKGTNSLSDELWETFEHVRQYLREFGNVRRQCVKLCEELEELQKMNHEPHTKTEQRNIQEALDDLLTKEEILWKQRSRADWLESGNRNTGFFHKLAEGRKRHNHIREIVKADRTKTRKNEEMDEVFRTHFNALFSASSTQNPVDVLCSIDPIVTEKMNRSLTMRYTPEEVTQALSQMHPLKAPGPDEALSGLLRKAKTNSMMHGACLCKTALRVSHLLFADDCIIFGRAQSSKIKVVKNILRQYEGASGQQVNLEKSKISFSSGVPEDIRCAFAGQLGVVRASHRGKYLGIPSTVGRSKTEIFQMLVDRTRKKQRTGRGDFCLGRERWFS
ncbi:uncharacterized protein LOC131002949 [Salvia miltiorrhiza]|uniref:uncharacterized protein LOC131002949 n=1 Tax=Salvia miltiorrhiza TaxID=226208 RepID=UPI0025ACF680|nr:uncharacterized protein LOC131002949 [Salvia miltiorrhiza]